MNEAGYEYCTAFFAALASVGVEQILVSPGSRSTPLTLSAHSVAGLELTVHHDERAAGFFALGLAKSSRRPVALICTSGTATANYLPAVVEAFYDAVPLIVLTADRPAELRGRGAPQTIDQVGIYGSHTRWATEMSVPEESSTAHAVETARRAVTAALGPPAGPVHLNWPLRKPLEPSHPLDQTTTLPTTDLVPALRPAEADVDRIADLAARERGLIVAGPVDLTPVAAAQIAGFATATGWPILADATSQLRCGAHVANSPVITTAHHLLGCDSLSDLAPDSILMVGGVPSSAAFERWLPATGAQDMLLIDPQGLTRDPTGSASEQIQADPGELLGTAATLVDQRGPSRWRELWTAADETAANVIARCLDNEAISEASVARELGRRLPPDALLYVSNSMPVRDVDLFLAPRPDPLRVLANRGANGIDGMTSSASGAAAGHPGETALLAGDLAFVHDASGLLVAGTLGTDLTIVVPNNDGGGIFSFLPIAETLDSSAFRSLFHTPHGLDLAQLSRAAGANHHLATTVEAFSSALDSCLGGGGLSVIEVPVSTADGIVLRRSIEREVVLAIADQRA